MKEPTYNFKLLLFGADPFICNKALCSKVQKMYTKDLQFYSSHMSKYGRVFTSGQTPARRQVLSSVHKAGWSISFMQAW